MDAKDELKDRPRRGPPVAVFALWVVVLAPVVLLDALVLVAFVVALRSESQLPMVLEVLRVAVAWPMVALAVAIAFGIAFRPEIGDSIKRIVIKVANVEIGTRQADEAATVPAAGGSPGEAAESVQVGDGSGKEAVDLAGSGAVEVAVPAVNADAKVEVTPDEIARLRELSAIRMRQWWWWWLQVVQHRLVARTVLVLRWLADQPDGKAPVDQYVQKFRPTIVGTDADVELGSILNTLLQYSLVTSPPSRATVTITDTGRQFLNYLDGKWHPLEDLTIT